MLFGSSAADAESPPPVAFRCLGRAVRGQRRRTARRCATGAGHPGLDQPPGPGKASSARRYSVKGLSTWTPARSKSLTLRVTTVMPCTRAVAAMSASITGRGWAYC